MSKEIYTVRDLTAWTEWAKTMYRKVPLTEQCKYCTGQGCQRNRVPETPAIPFPAESAFLMKNNPPDRYLHCPRGKFYHAFLREVVNKTLRIFRRAFVKDR